MKRTGIIILTLAVVLPYISAIESTDDPARAIIAKMVTAVKGSTGCTYNLHISERMGGDDKMHAEDMFNKVNEHPYEIYIKMTSGSNKGTEILFKEGENNNKALVNAGKFLPDISLSPYSRLLIKNEHHTIFSTGFDLVTDILANSLKRPDAIFQYGGDITWKGRNCFIVTIDERKWGRTTYTAAKGETVVSITKKLFIAEYFVMEWNGIKNFDDDLGGRTLTMPTAYAKHSVFYIDKQNYFPIMQEMNDEKGMFERYEYTDLIINPTFAPNEFNKNFKDYGF